MLVYNKIFETISNRIKKLVAFKVQTMIKDRELLEKFERKEYSKKRYTYRDALRIFEALWQEAKNLGAVPLKDLREGIDPILRIARALNYKK